jgi:segregation and condensation protein B
MKDAVPGMMADHGADEVRAAVRQLTLAFRRSKETLDELARAGGETGAPGDGDLAGGRQPVAADALRRAEAVLFAAGEPMSAQELAQCLPPGVEPGPVLMALVKAYAGRGVNLVEVGGKWQFRTAADLSFLFVETRVEPRKLSQAGLETLAIIAYAQPVTRAEIEAVRGVAVSRGTLEPLMEAGWVRARGRRRTPGRPVTYGTTQAFLEHFGLESLDMLPGRADLAGEGLSGMATPRELGLPVGAVEDPLEGDDPVAGGDGTEGAAFVQDFHEGEAGSPTE